MEMRVSDETQIYFFTTPLNGEGEIGENHDKTANDPFYSMKDE